MLGADTDESKLVLCTGAPGSMWSRVVRYLTESPRVDNSDWSPARNFNAYAHFGNYFGPGMEHGEDFANLAQTRPARASLLAEFAKPFAEPQNGRFRLLKSHAFAYSLRFLRATLPAARILLIWRQDEACLDWWLEAGGFSITYPNYASYRDTATMRRAIAAENAHILEFARESGVGLAATDLFEIGTSLGLWPRQQVPNTLASLHISDDVLLGLI
jgi:hypothetical protein